jgi:hypothetical protein
VAFSKKIPEAGFPTADLSVLEPVILNLPERLGLEKSHSARSSFRFAGDSTKIGSF